MSRQYDLYLEQHKENVIKGFRWMQRNIPEILKWGEGPGVDLEHQICFAHDDSKTKNDEYAAYDTYYYGGNRSFAVCQEYKLAWLKHLHRNPHHWQYWVLMNDEPSEGTVALDMPMNYIIEMILDWWAFSWKSGNLYEIFNWYNEHKDYMKLSPDTRWHVEDILENIKDTLDSSVDIYDEEDV